MSAIILSNAFGLRESGLQPGIPDQDAARDMTTV